MIRGSWVFRDGKLIEKSEAAQRDYVVNSRARSRLAAPYVKSDYIPAFRSHIDGKTVITSKAQWEKHARANGCDIVGNEKTTAAPAYVGSKAHRDDVKRDVLEAMEKIEQNYDAPPLPEAPGKFDVAFTPGADGVIHYGTPDLSNEPVVEKPKPKRRAPTRRRR